MAGLSTSPPSGSLAALNPGAGASAQTPGQPPFGSSPSATQPSAARGLQSAALIQVQWAVRLLEHAIPGLGSGSEVGQEVMTFLNKISKKLPAMPASSGMMNAGMQQFMAQQRANAPQQDVMRALSARTAQQPAPPAAA